MEDKDELKRMEKSLTEDAALLNQYLNQYKYCIQRKKLLERRRTEIIQELNSPLGAVKLNGMPKGSGDMVGCAAISFRIDEINSRIKEQIEVSTKILVDITDVIDFLPQHTMERSIIENRYIDRYDWNKVCYENHISRTPAIKRWKKGLYFLLDFKKVQQILKEYKDGKAKIKL